MDFKSARLNSSSLTCSICDLTAIILQLVAIECQNLHMVDSPINRPFSKKMYAGVAKIKRSLWFHGRLYFCLLAPELYPFMSDFQKCWGLIYPKHKKF